jgi:hypothetical protein
LIFMTSAARFLPKPRTDGEQCLLSAGFSSVPFRNSMSLAGLRSRALAGVEALAVSVEVHLANGLPQFTMVGNDTSFPH